MKLFFEELEPIEELGWGEAIGGTVIGVGLGLIVYIAFAT